MGKESDGSHRRQKSVCRNSRGFRDDCIDHAARRQRSRARNQQLPRRRSNTAFQSKQYPRLLLYPHTPQSRNSRQYVLAIGQYPRRCILRLRNKVEQAPSQMTV